MALKVCSYESSEEAKQAANNLISVGYRVMIREERDFYGDLRYSLYVTPRKGEDQDLDEIQSERERFRLRLLCGDCGYIWATRSDQPPLCPRCKSARFQPAGRVRSLIRRRENEPKEPVEDDATYTQKFFVENPNFLEID